MFQDVLRQGIAPQRLRWLLLLLLAPFAFHALLQSGWMAEELGYLGEELWDFFCLALALWGFSIRFSAAGYARHGNPDAGERPALHRTGAHSFVRYPVYLANFLIFLAVVLLFKSLLFAVLAIAAASLHYARLIGREDKARVLAYGDEYRAWAASTPAFIPRFTGWNAPSRTFDGRSALRREAATLALIALAFFIMESLEGTVVEGQNLLSWIAHEPHWFVLLAIGASTFFLQLRRLWAVSLLLLTVAASGAVLARETLVVFRSVDTTQAAFNALASGGHVLLLRHAATSGQDWKDVRPEDCTTQRNLSDAGRDYARAFGSLLRERGITIERTLSSAYCRCTDTASLMGMSGIKVLPDLNERKTHVTLIERLFGYGPDGEAALRPVRSLIAGWEGKDTLLVVSHAPNIMELTTLDVAYGEGVVLKPEPRSVLGFRVVGKISQSVVAQLR